MLSVRLYVVLSARLYLLLPLLSGDPSAKGPRQFIQYRRVEVWGEVMRVGGFVSFEAADGCTHRGRLCSIFGAVDNPEVAFAQIRRLVGEKTDTSTFFDCVNETGLPVQTLSENPDWILASHLHAPQIVLHYCAVAAPLMEVTWTNAGRNCRGSRLGKFHPQCKFESGRLQHDMGNPFYIINEYYLRSRRQPEAEEVDEDED